jgi:hypothetical protein
VNVYAKAASLGYPYLRGEGRPHGRNAVWLSRFTRDWDGRGPAIFVGFDPDQWKFVVQQEGGNDGRSKVCSPGS